SAHTAAQRTRQLSQSTTSGVWVSISFMSMTLGTRTDTFAISPTCGVGAADSSDPAPTVSSMATHQPAFDDPGFDWGGRPLHETTFCVVDLETTGGSPAKGSRITEFGAVKVHGGEILGEFQTLVNPDQT